MFMYRIITNKLAYKKAMEINADWYTTASVLKQYYLETPWGVIRCVLWMWLIKSCCFGTSPSTKHWLYVYFIFQLKV